MTDATYKMLLYFSFTFSHRAPAKSDVVVIVDANTFFLVEKKSRLYCVLFLIFVRPRYLCIFII